MPEARLNRVALSLGSNIDKERNIVRAVEMLAAVVRVVAVSSVYETAPVGDPDQESFLNAAVVVETLHSPEELKREVLTPIETRLGRRRTADKNAPRTIDIDIALFNDEVLRVGDRMIPDPELFAQAHLAVPLADVAPDYRHPVTGKTLSEVAAGLRGEGGIVRRSDLSLKGA
ncbi:MAG: 2-amino-4-hydroxy-6-hydroxymethyldihydropteridine diphosphokinase [Armatimonadetes bacterium]|nr:2-amino-4-hydroxy-6-hydroxymethyldihydropteridine diphosphokinase [Armatimonadota bacterium]